MGLIRSDIAVSPQRQERVIAVFRSSNDTRLVRDLIDNISPAVDGWIGWEPRTDHARNYGQHVEMEVLLAAARESGARWILLTEPDERFELALAQQIRYLTARDCPHTLWSFRVVHLFESELMRVDGQWGRDQQIRLFPAQAAVTIQSFPMRTDIAARGVGRRSSRLRLYRLRLSTPSQRERFHAAAVSSDPLREFQLTGYDYLQDDQGCTLVPIEPHRDFYPHVDKNSGSISTIAPAVARDPTVSILRRTRALRNCASGANAARLLVELASFPLTGKRDLELLAAAALSNLESGLHDEVEQITELAGDAGGRDLRPILLLLRGRARLAAGRYDGAASDFRSLDRHMPGSQYVETLLRKAEEMTDPSAHDAPWRRWCSKMAVILEGDCTKRSDLAVVIISLGAPQELRKAVESVIADDCETEIVVVNSGGGDAAGVLGNLLSHVRLINCEERLYAGAARNIGIDASRALFIAFLASDCTVTTGWSRARLRRHHSGAAAVASAVVSASPDCLASKVSSIIMHRRRHPNVEPEDANLFGASYARWVFTEVGMFPVSMRVGEDAHFNSLLNQRQPIVWAPEVVTRHADPQGVPQLLFDQWVRGYRRVISRVGLRSGVGAEVRAAWWNAAHTCREAKLTAVRTFGQTGVESRLIVLIIRFAMVFNALGGSAGAICKSVSRPSREQSVLEQSNALRASNEYNNAMAMLEEAISREPVRVDLWSTASELAHVMGDGTRALLYAQVMLALQPTNPAAHGRLAHLYRSIGNDELALQRLSWQTALAQRPQAINKLLEFANCSDADGAAVRLRMDSKCE
jgi:hypothetical protein